MRNRVVKQLLMVCMATALSVSMPMASWAADVKNNDSKIIARRKLWRSIFPD